MLYIFDMGGVLAQNCETVPAMARSLGVPEADIIKYIVADIKGLECGTLSSDEYWRRFEAASGLKVKEDYWATLFKPTLDAEVDAVIRSLRERGRVVCGTNTIPSHYDVLRERRMYDAFDEVYPSHVLGSHKPDAEFWLTILDAEGAEPSDAFFVDDNAKNIAAAEALGLRCHRFEGAAGLRKAVYALPMTRRAAE